MKNSVRLYFKTVNTSYPPKVLTDTRGIPLITYPPRGKGGGCQAFYMQTRGGGSENMQGINVQTNLRNLNLSLFRDVLFSV